MEPFQITAASTFDFSAVLAGWTETNSVWLWRREGPCQNRDNTPEKISLKGIWRVQLSLYASCK